MNGLGRRVAPDPRDTGYPMTALLAPEPPPITWRYWWPSGLWSDQGATGTCFPPGTHILMADGSERTIEEVRAGEQVVSHTGAVRMVEAVMARRYQGDLVSLRVRGSKVRLRMTPEHPVLATLYEHRDDRWGPRSGRHGRVGYVASQSSWVPAEGLRVNERNIGGHRLHLMRWRPETTLHSLDLGSMFDVEVNGDRVRIPGGKEDRSLLRFIDLDHEMGWLLGMYLAEGSLKGRSAGITFTMGSHEDDLIATVAKQVTSLLGVEPYVQQRPNNSTNVNVYPVLSARLFRHLGGAKARGKRLHSSLWSASDEFLTGVWDGFSAGDGYRRIKRGKTHEVLTTISPQLARDLWRIGVRLGYAPTLSYQDPPAEKRKQRAWRITRYHDAHDGFRPRQDDRIMSAVDGVDRESYQGLVYNLQVEHDRSYIAGGYAVHNCVGHAFAHFVEDGPVTWPGSVDPFEIYREATLLDPWPENDDGDLQFGTSIRAGAKALQAWGIISEYRWAWDLDTVVNALLSAGPVVVGSNWYACVTPDTRVLTSELEWTPAEKVTVGDELIGFDEHARRSAAYRRATVLSNDRLVSECVEIVTDRGSIVVSDDHLFVQRYPKQARTWTRAADLSPGDELSYFGEPWEPDRSWEAGWLAGFYDGEGSLAGSVAGSRSGNVLTCGQVIGPTAEFALRLLEAKGFDVGVRERLPSKTGHPTWQDQVTWYLRGENAKCRFLGEIRPSKLLAVAHRAWEGHEIRAMRVKPALVQEVNPIGREEVLAVGTSTGTLITEGFLSHNSMFNPDGKGVLSVDGGVVGGHAYLLNGVNTDRSMFRLKNSWGRGWSNNGSAWLRFGDLARLLSEDGEAVIAVEG